MKSSFGWKQANRPDDVFTPFLPGFGRIHNPKGHILRKTEFIWNIATLSVTILGLTFVLVALFLAAWGTDVYV